MIKRLVFIVTAASIVSAGCQKQDPWRKTVRPSATLGWEAVPNSGPFNSRGMLGPEIADISKDKSARILIIGDSFTENPYLLESLGNAARARGLKSFEFTRGGMRGYGPDQYYLWYHLYGHFLKPQLVFVFWFAGNDLSDQVKMKNNGGYQKPYFTLEQGSLSLHNYPILNPEERSAEDAFSPTVREEWKGLLDAGRSFSDKERSAGRSSNGLVSAIPYRIHYFLYAHFWPYRLLKDSVVNHWSALSAKKQQEQLALGDLWYLRHDAYAFFAGGRDLESAWTLNAAILDRMNKEIARDGGRMVLCLAPHLWQVDSESGRRFLGAAREAGYEVDLGAPRRRLEATATRLGIPFIDFTGPLRLAAAKGFPYDSKYSAAHWSKTGIDAVCESMAEYLKKASAEAAPVR